MAKEVYYRLRDDLDGTELAEGEGQTLKFTFGGTAYEIDLTPENAREFNNFVGRYAAAARKVPARKPRSTAPKANKEHQAKVRSWAAQNGHEVNPKGRIPQPILDAYDAAH